MSSGFATSSCSFIFQIFSLASCTFIVSGTSLHHCGGRRRRSCFVLQFPTGCLIAIPANCPNASRRVVNDWDCNGSCHLKFFDHPRKPIKSVDTFNSQAAISVNSGRMTVESSIPCGISNLPPSAQNPRIWSLRPKRYILLSAILLRRKMPMHISCTTNR